jgi:ribose transport system substrate-binding protein
MQDRDRFARAATTKRLLLATVVVLTTTALSIVATAFGAHSNRTASKPTIGLLLGETNLPYYTSMVCGAKDAAKKLGVNLNWQGPPTFDAVAEQSSLQSLLLKHPNGLVIVPDDPNVLNATLSQQVKSGVPLVTTDGSLSHPIGLANFRSNALTAGSEAADYLGKALHGVGTVQPLGVNATFLPNVQRVQGFTRELKKKYPKIKLLPVQYTNGNDPSVAARIISSVLLAHPDLNGIFASLEGAGTGSAQAVSAAGKAGKIKIVSFDADPGQVAALKRGTYSALVVQAPYLEGYDGVTMVVNALRHKLNMKKIKYQQYTPTVIATKSNLNKPTVKKLLYVTHC